MFTNYLKIALRNLARSKFYALINISGLAIGLSCCLLIMIFIRHELSYDKFHKDANSIFRVISRGEMGDSKSTTLAVTPAPWLPLIKKDYPEVKSYVRLLKDEKAQVSVKGEQPYYEKNLLFCDSTFFEVFSFELVRGNMQAALQNPNSIVLTETVARKYFGDADAVGKTLQVRTSFTNMTEMQVTGVIKGAPANSHFQFNALVPMSTLGDLNNFWSYHMFQSYVRLNAGTSKAALQEKFKGFVDRYIANNPSADGKRDILLQPVTDIHLYSQMIGEIDKNGAIEYIYIFSGIALFVLLIACFNFMNLSTVLSLKRAKEIGLRKVIGAARNQLARQFLGESIFIALVAMTLSLLITYAVLPVFNRLSERSLTLSFSNDPYLVIMLVGLALAVGLFSGLYPASVLSSFKPVNVLKGRFETSTKGNLFRKILVTVQFSISIALIASTIIVYNQLSFIRNKKLGFNKDNVMIVKLPSNDTTQALETFKSSLLNKQGVVSIAASSSVPDPKIPINQVSPEGGDPSKPTSMQMLFVDHDFINTMQMQVIAGRGFSKTHATDAGEGFVLNREAVTKMGWNDPAAAIGKTFQWVLPDRVIKSGKIIGVVENFNIRPVRSPVEPLVMHIVAQRLQYAYIRSDRLSESSIAFVEDQFRKLYPDQAFEYFFLDDTINSLYASEKKLGEMFGYFSFLAIFIGCMGILGLSVFSARQRIKEIGVRKVLGAGTASIVMELSKEFLKPVAIAALIASPIAWWAMNNWLQDFAYKVSIQWWVFVIAGIAALLIALGTVSFQAIKAALMNPVKSLRTE
jgi:putative ABC transport system permease protein